MTQQLTLIDSNWISQNMATVLDQMRGKDSFTSDDVHDVLPEPMSNNHWGCLLAHLRPHLDKIGYRPSTRPSANGRVVAVWRVRA